MGTAREQKLIDILFEIALRSRDMGEVSVGDHTEWIRTQLRECGFPCIPVGMSHGVLQKEEL